MLGVMSERPLLISAILTHAATYHGDVEIVSRNAGIYHKLYGAPDEPRKAAAATRRHKK